MVEYWIYDKDTIYKPPIKECIVFKVHKDRNNNILKVTYSSKYKIDNSYFADFAREMVINRKLNLSILVNEKIIWGKKAQKLINEFLENEARRLAQ